MRYQVIIVGGGPVGMGLAVELGQRGINCVVVERHQTIVQIPKGQGLTNRTVEHFYSWHCADELRGARLLPPGYPIGGITAYGNLLSEYWYAPAPREVVQPYFFQKNERLPQYRTEMILRRRAEELPAITCLFGSTAKSIEQDDDGVRVVVASEVWPYEDQILEADYVVGCDGARSLVREQVGIVREGPNYDQRMVLAVIRSRELHERLERFGPRTTFRVLRPELRGYWQFFGRVDVGEGFFFHSPVPNDTSPENYDFHGLLQQATGFTFACEFDHVGFWDMRVEVASRYRVDRVFIAGDASHSHPPYGGFGLNSGLEDATNLGWKLAAALDGWGGDRLLDSYSQERHPIFVETGQEMIAGGIERDRDFLDRYSPERDRREFEEAWDEMANLPATQQFYEPHYEGSSVVAGPPGAVCSIHGTHSFAARAGHHLSPLSLSSGHNVFEELGTDFTLLAFDTDAGAVQSFEESARSARVPLKVVQDTFERERTIYEARYVLVRPDQYVVWAGDDLPRDAASLLHKVAGT